MMTAHTATHGCFRGADPLWFGSPPSVLSAGIEIDRARASAGERRGGYMHIKTGLKAVLAAYLVSPGCSDSYGRSELSVQGTVAGLRRSRGGRK